MGFSNKPTSIGDIIRDEGREPRRPRPVTPPGGEPGNCRACKAPGTWHTTRIGQRVFLEPRPVPAAKIPHGKQWRVLENGIAVTLPQSVNLGHCRVAHFDVCPSRPAPRGGLLLALWEKYRAAQADTEGDE